MAIIKGKFDGDVNVGLYVVVNDTFAILPKFLTPSFDFRSIFEVEIINASIYECPFIGIFSVMNNKGMILPSRISDKEFKEIVGSIKRIDRDFNVIKLETNENVLGNLILCNDKGAIISETLKKYRKKIEDVLGVETDVGKIMDLEIVGSLGYATNKGFVISAYASEEEYDHVKGILKVEGDIATVNYGSPYVRSGIIANENSLVVGENTTPIEMGRIAESLGFV